MKVSTRPFVRGCLATGIGFTQAEELVATVNLPFMSYNCYLRNEKSVGDDITASLLQSMADAAAEEISSAKQRRNPGC